MGSQMSDSTQMTGTIGGRGSGGWSARILCDLKGRTATCDWRSLVLWPTSRRIRRCLYRYTMCKRIANRVLDRRDQTAPFSERECCLRKPASRSGRREAVSLHRAAFLPKRRHLRVGPSVGQRGKGERRKLAVLPRKHGAKRSLISLMGNIPAPERRRNPSCLVRRRFHAAGGRASRQLPG